MDTTPQASPIPHDAATSTPEVPALRRSPRKRMAAQAVEVIKHYFQSTFVGNH